MDDGQKWAVALHAHGAAGRRLARAPVDLDRTAVIIGNAIGGEKHYRQRPANPVSRVRAGARARRRFAALPHEVRDDDRSPRSAAACRSTGSPEITEDTMPGELGNCIAGRVANLFNFHGPNFTTDAACASALAAMDAAVDGLLGRRLRRRDHGRRRPQHGRARRSSSSARSARCRPPAPARIADGADGFVMGEGAALFVLKRLADAERDGDRIYAVLRGIGGASDGKGKGITAPNPVGQRLAVERAWRDAGAVAGDWHADRGARHLDARRRRGRAGQPDRGVPQAGAASGSIALGSVKSNIGHLKARGRRRRHAQGGARAAREGAAAEPATSSVPTRASTGTTSRSRSTPSCASGRRPASGARCAGVSAFGFGGTNFHVVLEEYVPGRHRATDASRSFAGASVESAIPGGERLRDGRLTGAPKPPLRGALVLGGGRRRGARQRAASRLADERAAGRAPAPACAERRALRAPERIAIDYADAADLASQGRAKALEALLRSAIRPRGRRCAPAAIHRGSGATGQGRVPVHRPGLAVREHARRPARREPIVADDVRRGRPDHGAAARAGRCRRSSSPTLPTRPRRPRPRRSCGRPRSPSRR